jgi:hypothetical protein
MKRDKHSRPTPEHANRDIPAVRFWDKVDRDAFESALSGNDKYATFLQALHDPQYSRCSFPALLRKFNISLHEAQTLYSDHMRHMGLLAMSSQLPAIMADVAEDAKDTMETCPRCDGLKTVPYGQTETRKCPACKGTGETRSMGNEHARELVFESMKLIRQRGPLVAIAQNIAIDGLDGRMESLLNRTRSIVLETSVNGAATSGDTESGHLDIIKYGEQANCFTRK